MRPAIMARKVFQSVQESLARKSVYQRLREYERFADIKYETDDFLVTTAKSGRNVTKVLELRHAISVKEWQGRSFFHGLDMDEYDLSADHLMIIDKRQNQIAGTYRLISSKLTQNFYSASEFDISRFLKTPGTKLELGRACVRPEYRDGITIDLSWRGLPRYAFATGPDILFVCTSIQTIEPAPTQALCRRRQGDGRVRASLPRRPQVPYSS